jgi:hypothetical protein
MKQFVIEQMKEYQHKKIIKGIEYKDGMEDAWLVNYLTYEDYDYTVLNTVNKIFYSKEEATKYMCSPTDETIKDNFCKYTECFPVLLKEISKEDYEDNPTGICENGQYFEYEELDEGYWIYIENDFVYTTYDKESFLDDYEPYSKVENDAYIGYDKDLEELYVEMNNARITIDKSEISVVERLFDGFGINFVERVGQYFKDND